MRGSWNCSGKCRPQSVTCWRTPSTSSSTSRLDSEVERSHSAQERLRAGGAAPCCSVHRLNS